VNELNVTEFAPLKQNETKIYQVYEKREKLELECKKNLHEKFRDLYFAVFFYHCDVNEFFVAVIQFSFLLRAVCIAT